MIQELPIVVATSNVNTAAIWLPENTQSLLLVVTAAPNPATTFTLQAYVGAQISPQGRNTSSDPRLAPTAEAGWVNDTVTGAYTTSSATAFTEGRARGGMWVRFKATAAQAANLMLLLNIVLK